MNSLASAIVTITFLDLYLILVCLIPAMIVSYRLPVPRLDRLVIGLVFGFAGFSTLTYLSRGMGMPFWLVELPLVLLSLAIIIRYRSWIGFFQALPTKNFLSLALVALLTSLIHGSVLIQSGLTTQTGTRFVELSYHDSMQHLSFIKRLWSSGQITHPGFAGASLNNYHYMIDSTLAAMTRFSFVSLSDAYYRYYPILISVIFSLSIYILVRRLTKNHLVSLSAIVFSLFAGNASYFFSYTRGPEFKWGSNAFIINPLIDLLQNPASIFVLSQLIIALYLLDLYQQRLTTTTKKSLTSFWLKLTEKFKHSFTTFKKDSSFFPKPELTWPILMILTIVTGSMIGFKAWGGIIITIGLGVALLWDLLKHRRLWLLPVLLGSGLISASIFLPGYEPTTSASPVWAPGWTLQKLIQDGDRWNYLPDLYSKDTFVAQGNTHGLIKIYTKWTLLYIVGNYWLRLIGLAAIFGLLLYRAKMSLLHVAVLSITSVSLFTPLLFNQGRMAYDIEQFSPYALLLASLATVVVVHQASLRLSHKLNFKAQFIFLVIFLPLLLLSVPSNWTSLKARLWPDTKEISHELMDLYRQVELSTDSSDVILLYPSQSNIATLGFATHTSRDTFYSGRTLSVITGHDLETRTSQLHQLFGQAGFDRRAYLDEHNIEFLFLHADEPLGFLSDQDWQVVAANSQGVFYQRRVNILSRPL